MTEDQQRERLPVMQRTATRRAVIGGTLAAGAAAAAYAALGGSDDRTEEASGPEAPQPSPATPSQPLTAAPAAPATEAQRIGHLLRRAGFAMTEAEFEHFRAIGLDATIDELLNYEAVDDSEALQLAAAFPVDDPAQRGTPPVWWLTRMANTKRPLQEKMTLFWHGLLTSQISEVQDPTAMVRQNELFRAQALGSFPDLLRDVARDPAMMVYLNIAGSSRIAPNENYARELMELFALGEGNYSEKDVREAARAFTGWAVPRRRMADNVFQLQDPVFRPGRFDSGVKSFLGSSGNFGPDDIVDIIVQQPAASPYIVRRLFNSFIYLNPSEEDLAPFVEVYEANGRLIGPVVEAMLRSEVFYSDWAYRALLKSPIEYAVGAVKAIGAQRSLFEAIAQPGFARDGGSFASMGQIPFEPPNVAGWPSGEGWLNSSTIFARLNFLNEITGGAPAQSRPRDRRPDARPAGRAGAGVPAAALPAFATAGEALDHLLQLVVDDNVSGETRQTLVDYAGNAELTPETLSGLVYLVLASPEFQLS